MSYSPYDVLRIVRNDSLPQYNIQLVDDETGDPVDLSDGTTVVKGRFRERGATETLFEITLSKLNGGEDGFVVWDWPAAGLDDLAAGRYEGEITMYFDEEIQTVEDLLRFNLVEDFAEVAS